MKRNAIVRLCIWSIISLLLIRLFAAWMTGGVDFKSSLLPFGVTKYQYKNADRYTAGNTEISERVKSLDVNWISGSVSIIAWDGDTVRIREDEDITDPDQQVHWYLESGRLHIQYCASKRFQADLPSKDLIIELPVGWASNLSSIEIETVSASVNLNDLDTRELQIESVSGGFNLVKVSAADADLDTVSGHISATDLNASIIDVETVSGTTTLSGWIGNGTFETGSGDVTLTSNGTPEALDLKTVSGNITLIYPLTGTILNEGFRVVLDTVSGDIKSELHYTKAGNNYSFGSGKHVYTFESVSGDLIVKEP